jgi:hypothetical protein
MAAEGDGTGETARFRSLEEGIVFDAVTDLMWAAKDNGADIGWEAAGKYCEDYKVGGFTDWRLPTQKELETLYQPAKKEKNRFAITELITLSECCVWASDVSMGGAANFSFRTGARPWAFREDSYKLRVLPVRDSK